MKFKDKTAQVPPMVWYLGIVSFFNDVASQMLYPVMPIFLTQVLGAPVFVVGIIEGIAEGAAALFKTYFGYWSDRLQRRKPFVVAGYGASAVAKLIIAIAYAWPLVLLGRFVDRLGKGMRSSARDALLNAASTPENRGFIFGLHRTMDTLGAVVGPIIALALLYQFNNDIRTILYVAAIPAFTSLIFFFFIKEPVATKHKVQLHLFASIKSFPREYKLFLIGSAIFALGNSADAFLILRAQDLGMTIAMTIGAYVLYNLVYALLATPAGIISDKIGQKKVFITGIIIFIFVYLGFALTHDAIYIWPLFAIYACYIALTDGVGKALVGAMVEKDKIATGYGVLSSVTSLCTLFASIVGGALWTFVAPEATFLFGAGCAVLSLFFFFAMRIPQKNIV